MSEEYARAFDNIEATLETAGASWSGVIHVNSYHVTEPGADAIAEEALQLMVEQFRQRMPDHAPIWTCIGVTALGQPQWNVEIRVTAITQE